MAYTTDATNALRSLFSEIHGELLDDCGDWDRPIDVVEIIDCAINGDWCEKDALTSIIDRFGICYDRKRLVDIALTLSNTFCS